ncbi:MAG TPA: hypothetical protein VH277_06515 [Gemmatimonadaceae bacterium]|jgi:TRAP-type uncharacterized transport system fused permease subunit|nr:hypothetical protein [Gemmatimonadaceae bacterium]
MALLVLGTLLSLAAPLLVLYWGGCARVTPPVARISPDSVVAPAAARIR